MPRGVYNREKRKRSKRKASNSRQAHSVLPSNGTPLMLTDTQKGSYADFLREQKAKKLIEVAEINDILDQLE